MYHCCDTVGKPEAGLRAVQVIFLCTIAVTLWGKPETGLHAVQVMLLCTIAMTLWGNLRLGFTVFRQCCYSLLL